MQEIKVQCDCGQRYKFDVEPVDGRIPFAVNCPVCGLDGTQKANGLLLQPAVHAASLPSPAIAQAAAPRLRINTAPASTAEPAQATLTAPPPIMQAPRAIAPKFPATARPRSGSGLAMGILGAFLGAIVGAGLMYGFYLMVEFRFPLLGVGIGALTGLGARLLSRGSGDNVLGGISAAIACLAVVATLYLMYGSFPLMNIISVCVSVSVAFRVASK